MSTNNGFTFIEILISLVITSMLIFAMDFVQVNSLRQTAAVYYYSLAVQAANELIERLSISNIENQKEIIEGWQNSIPQLLPQGSAAVDLRNSQIEIMMKWGDKDENCKVTKIAMPGCLYVSL